MVLNHEIPSEDKLFYEIIIDGNRELGIIFSSTFRGANKEDLDASRDSHKEGKCDKTVFFDVGGFMYNNRYCGICGKLIGVI